MTNNTLGVRFVDGKFQNYSKQQLGEKLEVVVYIILVSKFTVISSRRLKLFYLKENSKCIRSCYL
jgi:hypothetical protein